MTTSRNSVGQWMEHCKMLLNEYRLNPPQAGPGSHREADGAVFFGEGATRPLNTFLQHTECLPFHAPVHGHLRLRAYFR